MEGSSLPEDPWRSSGNDRLDDLVRGGRLWEALIDLEGREIGRAVGALNPDDLRLIVLGLLVCRRFGFVLARADDEAQA